MSKAIEQLLLESGLSISNTINVDEISNEMTSYGYTKEAMSKAKSLHDDAETLHQKQVKEYGEKGEASQDLQRALAEANIPYMRYVKIARIALRDNLAGWEALKLGGRRKKAYASRIAEARIFYTNLLADKTLLQEMARFGITEEKLLEGQKLVNIAENALALLHQELGQAQNATQERDEAVDKLHAWLSDFREIARIAMESKPQYLEMLGIIEPS